SLCCSLNTAWVKTISVRSPTGLNWMVTTVSWPRGEAKSSFSWNAMVKTSRVGGSISRYLPDTVGRTRPSVCRPGRFLPSPIRRQVPPTLGSTSHSTALIPTGPNHEPKCCGLVQASNTRSGSASKVRVMRRMRPLADSATALLLLGLGRGALQERVQLVELRLPEAAVELDPVSGGTKALAAQFATTPLRPGVAFD